MPSPAQQQNNVHEEGEAASSGLALPVSIPKSWLTTGALKCLSMQHAGPAGIATGSNSNPSPPTPLFPAPTGHSTVWLLSSSNVLLHCLTSKCVSSSCCTVGSKKLRFRMNQADITAIQSDPVARDDARVMLRRAFRLRGRCSHCLSL